MFLHSSRVDRQLKDTIYSRLSKSLDETVYFGFSSEYKPECLALVDLIFNIFSVCLGSSSPGMKCMGIKLNKTSSGRISRLIFGILTIWIHRRAFKLALSRGWREYPEGHRLKILWNYLHFFDLTGKLLHLLNYIEFLYSGVYPDVLYRMSGYQMFSNSDKSSITSAFRLVRQREIALQVLSSFAASSSLSLQWLRVCLYFVSKNIHKMRTKILGYTTLTTTMSSANSRLSSVPLAPNLSHGCGHCSSLPIESPHIAVCGHVFCYYCLSTEIADSHGGGYLCRLCGVLGSSCSPYTA